MLPKNSPHASKVAIPMLPKKRPHASHLPKKMLIRSDEII